MVGQDTAHPNPCGQEAKPSSQAPYLENRRHEDRDAHQDEDGQAGQPLLPVGTAQGSRVPRGPSGTLLPSRPPGSLLFPALTVMGSSGIPGKQWHPEGTGSPEAGSVGQRGHVLVPWLCSVGRASPRVGPRLLVYLMPRNMGCSPGAEDVLSFRRLSMCAREMTVAETYQGRPVTEVTTIRRETQRRSR